MSNIAEIDLEKYPGITNDMLEDFLTRAAEEVRDDNYLLIQLSWSNRIILKYQDGMDILDKLRKAETYESPSGSSDYVITPFKCDFEVKILARAEYVHLKLLNLLHTHKEKEEPKPDKDES